VAFPKDIELILTRHLATCIAMPMFIVDPGGSLLFYNEPAEALVGRRFDETGEMTPAEWSTVFEFSDDAGQPVPAGNRPLRVALVERRPAHGTLWASAFDGVRRRIGVTALPLIGQADRFVGAVAIFWETRA
jgi:PAS domain-containing protein